MRIDKFLKITRLIKRRTIANEILDTKKVLVNNNVVKASYNVKIGDTIRVNLTQINFLVKVKEIIENPRYNQGDVERMIEVIKEI
jgi:ribosomal 50S subunit-recycling heat shock protein